MALMLMTMRLQVSSYMFIIQSLVLVIILFCCWNTTCFQGNGIGDISPNVKNYEPILYDLTHVRSEHVRIKRDINNYYNQKDDDNSISIKMKSSGRDFPLKLIVNENIFHPSVDIQNSDGIIPYDTQKAVIGSLHGQPNSLVHGVISSNGTFDGVIETETGEQFYVEPSERYWNSNSIKSTGIIYKASDAIWPLESEREQEPITCASHKLQLLRKEEESQKHNDTIDDHRKVPQHFINNSSPRKKRWIVDPKKKTCMLYLQADYLFYSRVGSEEATIDIMTGHIQRLNQIYKNTDFDLDGEPDEIQFMIKRIKVYTKNADTDPKYPYEGNFEVIKFLEKFSEGDYDSFCLAYMFTFRDFEGGTLGLAWTGDLKNAGGVCEKQGHFRGGVKSLNTGIITLLNYGKVVSPAISHVTLAHEVGHNFGSPHDPDADRICTPGGEDGNYIMFARATAGDKRNNNRFSPCSLRSIGPVLNFKARNIHGCFTTPQLSICGNGVVEKGEECDCGWEEDCREPCCFPMRRSYGLNETPCRLKPGVECSPSKGPCCTGNCTLKHFGQCRDDNGCRLDAFCDGSGAACPPSILKPNKTICNKQNVCFMGECTGSICLAYGLESCQCNQESYDRPMKLCEICCKLPGDNQKCISSFDWTEEPYDIPQLYAKPGTPCRNYSGYCDSYHVCREVDPSGPLATLRKLLAADEGLATIAEWIDNHWYVAIGALVVLVILMILTAKLCGKTAKARLRKLTIMHSNIEAIQIQRTYVEDGDVLTVHPTAVRKKIPFKKKVRERRSKQHRNQNGHVKKRKSTVGASNTTDKSVVKGHSNSNSNGSLWKRKKKELPKLEMKVTNNNIAETKLESPLSSPNPEGPLLGTASVTPEPMILNNLPSTSASAVAQQQQSSQNPLSHSHDHEPKTAIVPHAKDANRRKGNGHKKKHRSDKRNIPQDKKKVRSSRIKNESDTQQQTKVPSTSSPAEASKSKPNRIKVETKPLGKQKSSSANNSDNITQETSHSSNPSSKPIHNPTKPNLHAVYKAPFSIKLEFTRNKSNSKNNENSNKPSASNAESKSNNKPSTSSTTKVTKSEQSIKSKQKNLQPAAEATSSSTLASTSKYKNSLLGRRRKGIINNQKNPSKTGELQILIPNTLEDDEAATPTTPATS